MGSPIKKSNSRLPMQEKWGIKVIMAYGTYKGRREENPGQMMWRYKGEFKSAWNAEQYKNKMILPGSM